MSDFPFLRNITHRIKYKNYFLIFLPSICPEASVVGGGLEEGGLELRRQTTAGHTTVTATRRRTEESIEMQDMK